MIRRFWTTDDWVDNVIRDIKRISYTCNGQFVDLDKYDIVPKESYKQSLLKQKEEELKELEDYYERRKNEIADERKRLTG